MPSDQMSGGPISGAPASGGASAAAGGTYGRAAVPVNTARANVPGAGGPGAAGGAQAVNSARASVPGVGGPGGAGQGPAVGSARPGGVESAPRPGGGATARTGDGAGSGSAVPVGKSRTRLVVALAVVVVLVLAAAVVGLVRPGPVEGWLAGDATPAPTKAVIAPDPAPTPVLVAASDAGVAPTAAKVKAALDPLVGSSALGSKVHVRVLDVASGRELYARNADLPTTPASTTKLLTAATVLAARGPAYRLTTRAVAGSKPGEVVLVGGGDPTLSVNAKGQFPGAARLDQLASTVKKALGGTKPTKVSVDTSLFSGPETAVGWSSDDISPAGQVSRIQSLMTNAGRVKPVHNEFGGDPRYADPAIAAGKAFAKLLGAPTASVKRAKAGAGRELGAVQSPPLVQVTDWMLQQSDNTIAETLGRQVALAAGKPGSFDAASEAMIAKLGELGLPGEEADLYDASGLSRNNGISPTLLTDMLLLAASGKQVALTGIFGGLPVAGWSGTLTDRFVTPKANRSAQGVVRAKTGTLSGVNTMAGELITKDGRLLVFAIMASGSADAVAGKAAVDKVSARLVACGC
ncbi:D-alanyl-D-alanine carboxypeptidase/D-alanyl-D-alanine endopeptidase [Micromonosporaceae bacterium Da 78-11]